MNETDIIRRQLSTERAHLREILLAVPQGLDPGKLQRPVTAYVEWAGRRLLNQLDAHRRALRALPIAAAADAQLNAASIAADAACAATAASPNAQAQRLLALLEACSALEVLAGASLRVAHWRQAAHLSADTILEERQRYAAARMAAGLK